CDARVLGAAQADGERLVVLVRGVTDDWHGDRLRGHAGGERECAGGGPVVVVGDGGGAVGGGEVDGHRDLGRPGQGDREDEVRRPRVALGSLVASHLQRRRRVIFDLFPCTTLFRSCDARVLGAAQADGERLVVLVRGVADDRYGDRLRGHAGGER